MLCDGTSVKHGREDADPCDVTPTRCPACSARLRDGDTWCGQCHADLRPRPPAPVVVPDAAAPAAHAVVLDGAAVTGAARRSGRRAAGPPSGGTGTGPGPAGTAGRIPPAQAEALAQEWAARLAGAEAGAGLPSFVSRTSGRGGRAALAVGAGLGLGVVLLLLMAGVGVLL